MMKEVGNPRVSEHAWRRKFISDTFHSLAQPLTALHCSLELALMKDDPELCRSAIEDALGATDRLIATTTYLRELAYAEDPGEPAGLNIGALLLTAVDELRPVAEAGRVQIEAKISSPMEVFADATKLEQALFLLMNESLNGIAEGGAIEVSAAVAGHDVIIGVRGMLPDKFNAESRAMQIVKKMFRATAGEVDCAVEDGMVCVRARVPLHSPCASPLCDLERKIPSAVSGKTLINKLFLMLC